MRTLNSRLSRTHSKCSLAVPTVLMRTLELDPPASVAVKSGSTVVDGIDIAVNLYSFTSVKEVETLFCQAVTRGCAPESVALKIDGKICPLLMVKKEPSTEAVIDRGVSDLDNARSLIESDLEKLRCLSRLTGLRIKYLYDVLLIEPPQPEEPATINLFAYARPPGILRGLPRQSMPVKELFGLKVWKSGETRLVYETTAGRGRLIDDEGTRIFQVLGSNYYQLCLTFFEGHDPIVRTQIFAKLLGRLYADLDEHYGREPARDAVTPTDEALVIFCDERARESPQELREHLVRTESEIKKLEEKLFMNLHERQAYIVRLRMLTDSAFLRELNERLPGEFAKIREIGGVAALRIVDDGLHIETEPVGLERGGRRYNLGPFVIRLDPSGLVGVWSENPRHPKGHHHPHIDRVNLACFGNVTVPIAKFMSAYRFADAVRLVISWLGTYCPETSLISLEEWPTFDDASLCANIVATEDVHG